MQWHDTPTAAVAEKRGDLEADGFVLCETSEGYIAMPPESSHASPRYLTVVYSERRDQYRCRVSLLGG